MQVTGTIIEILEPSTIASANGDIKMQQFVIETNEEHPNKIFFSAFFTICNSPSTIANFSAIKIS